MNTRNIQFASNRMTDVERRFHEVLDPIYGASETRSMFLMLAEAFLEWDTTAFLLHRADCINQSDLLKYHWAIEDLKKHRPIQHIIGYTWFCGCKIHVNENVLVPRPETEEIVESVIHSLSILHSPLSSVLDLCTGSGCIAIAIKKAFPSTSVTAVDISEPALAVARQNAKENGVDINFIQANVLSMENSPFFRGLGDLSLIISNPPYVLDSERADMQRNVLDYDPELALFVPDEDPLRFYKAIVAFAKDYLAPSGHLVLEINETQGQQTVQLLQEADFSQVIIHPDFRDKDRCVEGVR